MRSFRSLLLSAAIAFVSFTGPALGQSFQDLGTVPGQWDQYESRANSVSGDGRVVVGSGTRLIYVQEYGYITHEQAVRWEDGVLAGLGEPYFAGHERSIAWGASHDGSVVVGQVQTDTAGTEVLVYDSGSISSLPDLPGGSPFARGNAVSADGSLIVGYANTNAATRATTWTWPAGTPTIVGTGFLLSQVRDTSADGSVWVGRQDGAAMWTDGVAAPLPAPPGSFGGLVVYAVSADGTTAVGTGSFEFADEAVVWSGGSGQSIGGLGSVFRARALDVSGDGSVVVGWSDDNSGNGLEAFLWNASDGMRALEEVLENDHGLDLSGWALEEATGISDDGLTVVGVGVSPSGFRRGFVATLGSPDADGDGIADPDDNCLLVANPSQADSNQDGFGNACDADLSNDGVVGLQDLSMCTATMGLGEGHAGYDPDADHSEPPDGWVGLPDLSVLIQGLGQPPGPSGLACAMPYHDGSVPCTAGP